MYDIITFGSATQDIHVRSNKFEGGAGNLIKEGGIFLPFGSKIDVSDIAFTTGGGGTNTAATFALQGFKTAFCGAIGADLAGLQIIRELRSFGIDTKFVLKKKEKSTNSSIIITIPGGDRIAIIYRGASDIFSEEDIQWKNVKKTKWFYLAPLTGEMGKVGFEKIIKFAKENKIKIACNSSKQQLSLPQSELKNILQKADILFLNLEEASYLSKASQENEREIFRKISQEFCNGIIVITKGAKGASVFDGKNFYLAGVNSDRKIMDTTGAGDSFASGFLSSFMRENNIEKAIQLGIANSEANLSVIGAKTGLLKKREKFNPINVEKI